MRPTVGRIVHYYDKQVADRDPSRPGYGFNGAGAGPYPAMVSQVFEPGLYANLTVFPPFGETFHAGSVSHQDDAGKHCPEDHVPERYWVWPPREAQPAPASVLGYCPVCDAPGESRERRLHGNDRCERGHTYASQLALKAPRGSAG